MKKLSVVVPCYNVADYLVRCLDSLLEQDLDAAEYEVIAVDDGSTDATGEILDRYAADHLQLKVIHKQNSGVSFARNTGLDMAQGEYVWLVDGDDYVAPCCMEKLLEIAQQNSLDLLAFGSMAVNDNEPQPIVKKLSVQDVAVQSGASYLSANWMQGPVWWYMVKRELLNSEPIRFPEGHMLEDSPFTPDVLLSAQRMAKIDAVCYFYVQRGSSIMHSTDKEHRKRLLDDYIYAYRLTDAVIAKHRAKMDDSAYCRLTSRRNSFLYFGIFRALKAGVLKDYYSRLNYECLFPLQSLDPREFPAKKWRLLRMLFNSPKLMICVETMFKILK